MPRPIHIQVFYDALPLEGVPTWVKRVANRCALKNHLYFLCVLLPDHRFMCVTTDLCSLKILKYVSTLKKHLPHKSFPGKSSDTTCNIPDVI
jgi:hypothetical protein